MRVTRVGVTGKTGAGKTTVSALLALAAAATGRRVLVVDTDDSPNLAISLGLGADTVPTARQVPRALVTGRAGGGVTPEQLVAGYGLTTPSGVIVLHAMAMSDEASGCGCAAHASVRSVLGEAMETTADLVVMDLEGGLDHLDRPSGTMAHVDLLLVVLEASRKSALSAGRAIALARASGVTGVVAVGNKARSDEEDGADDLAALATFAAEHGVALAAVLPWSDDVFEADRAGNGLALWPGPLTATVGALLATL